MEPYCTIMVKHDNKYNNNNNNNNNDDDDDDDGDDIKTNKT